MSKSSFGSLSELTQEFEVKVFTNIRAAQDKIVKYWSHVFNQIEFFRMLQHAKAAETRQTSTLSEFPRRVIIYE